MCVKCLLMRRISIFGGAFEYGRARVGRGGGTFFKRFRSQIIFKYTSAVRSKQLVIRVVLGLGDRAGGWKRGGLGGDQCYGRGGTHIFTGVFQPLARVALYPTDEMDFFLAQLRSPSLCGLVSSM